MFTVQCAMCIIFLRLLFFIEFLGWIRVWWILAQESRYSHGGTDCYIKGSYTKIRKFCVLKRQLSKVFFPIGNFPHVKFPKWLLPNVQFPKRQPKSFLAKEHGSYPYLVAALDPLTYLNSSARGIRRPKLTFGKLSLE